jgi:hypothetical protein
MVTDQGQLRDQLGEVRAVVDSGHLQGSEGRGGRVRAASAIKDEVDMTAANTPEPIVEHAVMMSGGGMHVRNADPEVERIFWPIGSEASSVSAARYTPAP